MKIILINYISGIIIANNSRGQYFFQLSVLALYKSNKSLIITPGDGNNVSILIESEFVLYAFCLSYRSPKFELEYLILKFLVLLLLLLLLSLVFIGFGIILISILLE